MTLGTVMYFCNVNFKQCDSHLKVEGVTESSVNSVCITTTWILFLISLQWSQQIRSADQAFPREKVAVAWNLFQSTLCETIDNSFVSFVVVVFNSPQGKIDFQKVKIINDRQLFTYDHLPCCCLTGEILLPPAKKVDTRKITTTRFLSVWRMMKQITSRAALLAASQGGRRAATSWRTPSCHNHKWTSWQRDWSRGKPASVSNFSRWCSDSVFRLSLSGHFSKMDCEKLRSKGWKILY